MRVLYMRVVVNRHRSWQNERQQLDLWRSHCGALYTIPGAAESLLIKTRRLLSRVKVGNPEGRRRSTVEGHRLGTWATHQRRRCDVISAQTVCRRPNGERPQGVCIPEPSSPLRMINLESTTGAFMYCISLVCSKWTLPYRSSPPNVPGAASIPAFSERSNNIPL